MAVRRAGSGGEEVSGGRMEGSRAGCGGGGGLRGGKADHGPRRPAAHTPPAAARDASSAPAGGAAQWRRAGGCRTPMAAAARAAAVGRAANGGGGGVKQGEPPGGTPRERWHLPVDRRWRLLSMGGMVKERQKKGTPRGRPDSATTRWDWHFPLEPLPLGTVPQTYGDVDENWLSFIKKPSISGGSRKRRTKAAGAVVHRAWMAGGRPPSPTHQPRASTSRTRPLPGGQQYDPHPQGADPRVRGVMDAAAL